MTTTDRRDTAAQLREIAAGYAATGWRHSSNAARRPADDPAVEDDLALALTFFTLAKQIRQHAAQLDRPVSATELAQPQASGLP